MSKRKRDEEDEWKNTFARDAPKDDKSKNTNLPSPEQLQSDVVNGSNGNLIKRQSSRTTTSTPKYTFDMEDDLDDEEEEDDDDDEEDEEKDKEQDKEKDKEKDEEHVDLEFTASAGTLGATIIQTKLGCFVSKVIKNSVAKRIGLQPGDLFLSLNGMSIPQTSKGYARVYEMLLSLSIRNKPKLIVIRRHLLGTIITPIMSSSSISRLRYYSCLEDETPLLVSKKCDVNVDDLVAMNVDKLPSCFFFRPTTRRRRRRRRRRRWRRKRRRRKRRRRRRRKKKKKKKKKKKNRKKNRRRTGATSSIKESRREGRRKGRGSQQRSGLMAKDNHLARLTQ